MKDTTIENVPYPEPSGRLLGISEAATYLAISHWSLRTLIDRGDLPAVRIGRRLLIDREDLDSLIENHKERAS